MPFTLSMELMGLCASILAELCKLIPVLKTNSVLKSITAIIIVAFVAFVTSGNLTFQNFINVAIFALGNYLAIVQPVAKTMGLPTQS